MITNRIRIIWIIILTFTVVTPDATYADWKIYYTGVIGQQSGYHGRGSFATQPQCEQYRMTMPGSSMSYCGGFDTPTSSHPGGDDGTAAREQEKQRQLQLQREQKEKEKELERQKKFAEEKDKLMGSFKGTHSGTLGLKTGSGKLELKSGTGTPGLEKPTGKHKRDAAIADSTTADMQKLTKYREELYKLQVDQQKITQSFGDINREFSDIGKGVKEIIDANESKLFKTAADATTDLIAIRKKNVESYKQAYDIIDTITSYPKIMDMDDLVKQLKGTISYIGKYKNNIQLLDWTVKAAEAWKDFYQGSLHAKRLYELELECRALLLDTGNNRTRQQKLMQDIEVLRQRIHEVSGIPLSQIPATPLRPAGLGSYVPKIYPTEESLTKARQKGVK